MNREQRRKNKQLNNDPVYSIKRSELERKLAESYQKGYENGIKKSNIDASGKVFTMLLGLPCKVLRDHFGFGFRKRLPRFADILITEYQKFDESTESIEMLQEIIYQETGIKFIQEEVNE